MRGSKLSSQEQGPVATVRVVYDKECPVCRAYCEMARRSAEPGSLELVDARGASALMDTITHRGLDIDEGMVTEIDGELHYGAAGIRELALTSRRKNLFNACSRLLFGNARVARVLYNGLKALRRVLLNRLGVRPINNLQQPDNERF